MIGRWKAGLQRGERKGGDRLRVSGAGQDSGQAESANCAPGKGPQHCPARLSDLHGGLMPGLVLVPCTSRPSRSTHQQYPVLPWHWMGA